MLRPGVAEQRQQLADELYGHLIARGWLRRDGGRAVALTSAGERELLPLLGNARP
jgi:hypothetical protein